MKKVNRKFAVMRALAGMVRQDEIRERLCWASAHAEAEIFERFATRQNGLDAHGVELAREKYGCNIVSQGKKNAAVKRFLSAFMNPFTGILLALAVISAFTDIVFAVGYKGTMVEEHFGDGAAFGFHADSAYDGADSGCE